MAHAATMSVCLNDLAVSAFGVTLFANSILRTAEEEGGLFAPQMRAIYDKGNGDNGSQRVT